MSPTQAKLLSAGVLALLAWLASRKAPPARVTSTLDIDANVYSPTFGEPLRPPTAADEASHAHLIELVDESTHKIAEYDEAHPWDGIYR